MKRSRARGMAVCAFCNDRVPWDETARTLTTPDTKDRLPAGCGWVICGPLCDSLPKNATVIYRPRGYAWTR